MAEVFLPNGIADFVSVPVTVQACALPSGQLPVVLHFRPNLKGPNTVEFMVHTLDSKGHETLISGPATYTWTFGDGQTATTTTPLVTHDYSGYRFYMYSRSDQAAPALSSAPGWSVGTEASQCSLFDTLAAQGARLPRPLWPSKSPSDQVPDGMRRYKAEGRLTSAQGLYALIHAKVDDVCHSKDPVDLCGNGNMQDAVANQFVNCFARDACDDTSHDWGGSIAEGVAVAPDDLLNWDLYNADPNKLSGMYGYNEAAVYVPFSFRHRYVWAATPGDGSLQVKVVDGNGKPFPNATVIIDGAVVGLAATDGTLSTTLAAGPHDVEAQSATPIPPTTDPPWTAAQILALPSCVGSNTSVCQTSNATSDPNNPVASGCQPHWLPGKCVSGACTQYLDCDQDFNCTVSATQLNPTDSCVAAAQACVCNPPPPQIQTCTFQHSGRLVNVAGAPQQTMVTITLCNMGCDPSGVPIACASYCTLNADCPDGAPYCDPAKVDPNDSSRHTCGLPPRKVHIAATSAYAQTHQFSATQVTYSCNPGASLDFTCDPSGNTAPSAFSVDYCIQGDTSYCGTNPGSDSDGSTFHLDGSCQQVAGGIVVTLNPAIEQNCGSGSKKLDQNQSDGSGGTTRLSYYTVTAPAPDPGDPTHSNTVAGPEILVCYSVGDVCINSSFLGTSCPDACSENYAKIVVSLTNEPAQ